LNSERQRELPGPLVSEHFVVEEESKT